MLKNIFRSRRRSKNGPFGDENEPADHIGSESSKMVFPNIASGALHEEHVLSSHSQPFQLHSTGNVMSATDVRYQHADTEYMNRVASCSQVAGQSGKHNSGQRAGKRHRLSSVVNKILMTRSESTPAPRTMRMVASDLYSPVLSTKEQTYKNDGIPPSDICEDTDNDSVFAIPSLCQSCVTNALPSDGRKTRFQSESSWMCSQCRMQSVKARDRHRSTVSSPAELCTPSVGDNSEELFKPKSKQAITSNTSNNGKVSSVHDVTVCDDTPCRNDALSIPSPLHVCDLESKLPGGHDDDDDDDDDVVPELVEISDSFAGAAGHYKHHSSPIIQPTVDSDNGHVNESAMYILTDSFLDYSSTSFAPSAAMVDSSQSTVVGQSSSEVMVAYDSESDVMLADESSYVSNGSLVVSPQLMGGADKSSLQPAAKATCQTEEKKWCRKPLSDWSTDDVLRWVVSSGLVQFYDTFHSKLLPIITYS